MLRASPTLAKFVELGPHRGRRAQESERRPPPSRMAERTHAYQNGERTRSRP